MRKTAAMQSTMAQPQALQHHRSCASLGNQSCRLLSHRPLRRTHIVHAERKFNEGAAQVKRLLNRDRSSVPDLDKPAAFGTDDDVNEDLTQSSPESSGRLSEPFPLPQKAQLAKPSAFGGSAIKQPLGGQSPFGGPSSVKPFKEPSGLSPDMEISPLTDEAWWKSITLTQVVIALSFIFTIGLMIATFWVVWKMGAIRLNSD